MTPTTSHTPGPWTATETGVYGETITSHGNYYVAALPFPAEPTDAVDQANLRLIAAAPDLLAVARLTLRNVDSFLHHARLDAPQEKIESLKTWAARARAAIAKAERSAA